VSFAHGRGRHVAGFTTPGTYVLRLIGQRWLLSRSDDRDDHGRRAARRERAADGVCGIRSDPDAAANPRLQGTVTDDGLPFGAGSLTRRGPR